MRRLRVSARLTQKELGRKAGMRQGLVSRYERGYCEIGVANLARLAAALRVDIREIDPRCQRSAWHDEENVDEFFKFVLDNWQQASVAAKAAVIGIVANAVGPHDDSSQRRGVVDV